jgi:uncharacterized protein (TIGR03437 family)
VRRSWFFLLTFVIISCASAQTPDISRVVNAASFTQGQPVAPGSLASIFGSELASSLAQAASVPLSVSLADVQSVTFDDVPAPLIFVDSGQINLQIPWEVASSGAHTVVLHRDSGVSQPVQIPVNAFSPGIFAVNFGIGPAIAINADSSLAAPAGSIPGIATHPARAGDIILILCTGLGPVDQPVKTGAKPTTLTHTLTTPTVLIGGVPAQVQFSGLSPDFPGVNQLNVVVPEGVSPGDALPLQIQLGDITTTDQVTIAIR